ncbi:hypothetical protein GYMLUDRAFT_127904, partial [Collybiopsis luxurians FD-317 M1]
TSANSSLVTTVSHHQLQCTDDDAYKAFDSPTIKVGPFDQLVAFMIPIAVIFVYKKSGPADPINVQRLQVASERLLDYYPHLTGRFQLEKGGTYTVHRLGTGAELLVAECNEPLEAFASTQGRISLLDLPDGGNALLPPFDATLEGICQNPLLTIQHTRFACGSVGLGVRTRHCLCDADGFFQLVRDLTALYRGLGESSSPPYLAHPPHICAYMSDLPEMSPEERQESLAFQPSLLRIVDPVPEPASQPTELPPPVLGRILRFSGKAVRALKADATDPNDAGAFVSTFEAISALLHQSVYQARLQHYGGDPSLLSPLDFLNPVNFRAPSRLDLPPRYFPNALFCLYTTFSHDVLLHAPLWQVAKRLHDMNRNGVPDADHIKQTLRWIDAQPDKSRIESGFRYGNGSLMVSQWNKFGMYDGTQFQEGENPVLVSTPFTSISLVDGLAYVLPTEMEGEMDGDKGAVDVNLALSEPVWKILEQNERF